MNRHEDYEWTQEQLRRKVRRVLEEENDKPELARAMRAERPGIVFARAAATGETDAMMTSSSILAASKGVISPRYSLAASEVNFPECSRNTRTILVSAATRSVVWIRVSCILRSGISAVRSVEL